SSRKPTARCLGDVPASPPRLCSCQHRKGRKGPSGGVRVGPPGQARHRLRDERANQPRSYVPRARPWDRKARSEITAELVLKRRALIGTQAADPARFGLAEPLHDLPCPHLANAWHGLKQRRDLHLAHSVVRLPLLQDSRERDRATLQVVLDLSTILTCLSRLLQGSSALSGSEGRKSHSVSPRVSNRKHWFGMGK